MNFKFEIGETLTHIAGTEVRLFVIERTLQECPGGIQRHYQCRIFSRAGVSSTGVIFNENELMRIPAPDPGKEAGDVVEAVKGWAVGIHEFDLAAKLRDLKQKIVDAAIEVGTKR